MYKYIVTIQYSYKTISKALDRLFIKCLNYLSTMINSKNKQIYTTALLLSNMDGLNKYKICCNWSSKLNNDQKVEYSVHTIMTIFIFSFKN